MAGGVGKDVRCRECWRSAAGSEARAPLDPTCRSRHWQQWLMPPAREPPTERPKQRGDATAHWIDPGDVRTLGGIAGVAGQRQIGFICEPQMFERDDVIQLKGQLSHRLRQVAVLAAARATDAYNAGGGWIRSAHAALSDFRDSRARDFTNSRKRPTWR